MDYGIKPVTYNCTCTNCQGSFTVTTCGTGPVNTCNDCYGVRLEEVWGSDWKSICVLFK